MLRTSSLLFTACAVVASAGAQGRLHAPALAASKAQTASPQTLTPQKAPGPVRHAGIYHLATGTWTRTGGAIASFGPDVVYSNTAFSGYFSSAGGVGGFAPGSTNYDTGNLPTTQNLNNPGDRDRYYVNGFQIGYCDLGAPGTSGWEVSFYDAYTVCEGPALASASFNLQGMPAGGCWTVTIDLDQAQVWPFMGDGGNGFDDDTDLDTFGWSYRYTGSDGTAEAGFQLAGDPSSTDPNFVPGGPPVDGTNTYFGPASLCSPTAASGLLTDDAFYLEDPTTLLSNCYWFGGYSNSAGCGAVFNPYSSWSFEIYAGPEPGGGGIGCLSNPNSTGVNSTLVATGSLSVAADAFTLTASVPPGVSGYFLTSQTPGFVPNPAGSAGNLCLGADIGRFQNLVANSGAAGILTITTTNQSWSLASIPQGSGPYAATPGMSTYFQCWHRDMGASGPLNNFSDGVAVTWEP